MNMDEYDSMKPAESFGRMQRERDKFRSVLSVSEHNLGEARRERDEWAGQVSDLRRGRDEAHGEVRIARAGKLVAEQALQQTDDALSACRASNAELQRERDEAVKTCSLVQDDFTRLERERNDLRHMLQNRCGELAEEKSAYDAMHASRELALVELDEKVKRIAELEIDLDDTRNLLAQSEMDLATATTRANYWQTKANAPPAADWRKTLDATKLQLIAYIAAGEGPYIGDTEDAIELIARWEPKS